MCDNNSNNFLTVNNEDFISPMVRKRHLTRHNRSISPDIRAPSPTVSFDESLLSLNSGSETPPSTEDFKPAKAMCKGTKKKKKIEHFYKKKTNSKKLLQATKLIQNFLLKVSNKIIRIIGIG